MTVHQEQTFDPALAATVTNEAIHRADTNAPPEWKIQAMVAIRRISKRQPTMTADDVWAEVGKPPEPSALGPVMRAAAKAGTITKTDRVTPSARPEAHQKQLPIWVCNKYERTTHNATSNHPVR
jgi:hypothetical protein